MFSYLNIPGKTWIIYRKENDDQVQCVCVCVCRNPAKQMLGINEPCTSPTPMQCVCVCVGGG